MCLANQKHIAESCIYNDVLFLSYRHLILGQPAKVLYLLTSPPTQRPKEMDLKLVESVTSKSVTRATVDQPESEPMLPAGDWEKSSTEIDVIAGSSGGQLKQLFALPSSCTSDGVSDLCDVSVGNSESLEVKEQLPVSGTVPEDETRDQKSKS